MINMDNQIEIQLSKTKIIFLIIGALLFVTIGLWFMITPPEISHSGRQSFFYNPTFLFFVGLLSVLFFGICFAFGLKKFFDKKPGLILNEKGVFDNSSGLSIGLIPWVDIEEVAVISINSNKFIVIRVNNPQDYLDKAKNRFTRKSMAINYKWYGSPIAISAHSLQIRHKDLYELLVNKIKEYRSNKN